MLPYIRLHLCVYEWCHRVQQIGGQCIYYSANAVSCIKAPTGHCTECKPSGKHTRLADLREVRILPKMCFRPTASSATSLSPERRTAEAPGSPAAPKNAWSRPSRIPRIWGYNCSVGWPSYRQVLVDKYWRGSAIGTNEKAARL